MFGNRKSHLKKQCTKKYPIAHSIAGIVKTENVITEKGTAAVHVYFMFLPTHIGLSLHCRAYAFMHVFSMHVIRKGQGGRNVRLE